MGRHDENTGFTCINCDLPVRPSTDGSYRNHCPGCLWSRHVDEVPGDRASACHAAMAPVGVRERPEKGGWQVVHRCTRCGARRANRVTRDGEQPDSIDVLIALMRGVPR